MNRADFPLDEIIVIPSVYCHTGLMSGWLVVLLESTEGCGPVAIEGPNVLSTSAADVDEICGSSMPTGPQPTSLENLSSVHILFIQHKYYYNDYFNTCYVYLLTVRFLKWLTKPFISSFLLKTTTQFGIWKKEKSCFHASGVRAFRRVPRGAGAARPRASCSSAWRRRLRIAAGPGRRRAPTRRARGQECRLTPALPTSLLPRLAPPPPPLLFPPPPRPATKRQQHSRIEGPSERSVGCNALRRGSVERPRGAECTRILGAPVDTYREYRGYCRTPARAYVTPRLALPP
ncbi:Protein of unknown function [Gryllus bimaculatus]|nr:Protein of unknown function [Gryllus bimaculatus]